MDRLNDLDDAEFDAFEKDLGLGGGGGGAAVPPPSASGGGVLPLGAAPPKPGTVAVAVPGGGNSGEDGDVLPEEDPDDDGSDPIEKCFELITTSDKGITEMERLTMNLRQLSALYRNSFDPTADESEFNVRVMTQEVVKKAREVQASLKDLKKQTLRLKRNPENNPAIIGIQENQHAHLIDKFIKATNDYRAVVEENDKMLRDQTVRRIKVKYRNEDKSRLTDEQAQMMAMQVLESNTQAHDHIFQQSKDTLAQILETRADLQQIQRSLRDLLEMFNDLAVILNEQSEVLGQITQRLESGLAYVEKGNTEARKARKYAKKGRKKLCCGAVLLCVIVGFITAVVLGAVIPVGGPVGNVEFDRT